MDESIKLIIACEAFRGELAYLGNQIAVDILWIEHSLHNNPQKLNLRIKATIAQAEQVLASGDTVLLMFGNCGGALEGLESERLNFVYPEVADCIPIIMGSLEKYHQLQASRPGTFYCNKAWIDSEEDPLGAMHRYIQHYGQEKGWKVSQRMFQHYTHFSLIDNGCADLAPYRKHVQQACQQFKKAYAEEKGSLEFIQAILARKCPMVYIPQRQEST